MKKKKQTFSVLFWLRKGRTAENMSPLYCRITIAGQRYEIPTNFYLSQSSWSSTAQRAIGRTSNDKEVNRGIERITDAVEEAVTKIRQKNYTLNIENFKLMYLAQDNEYSTISSLFEYHDILESKNLSHSSKTAYVDAYNLTNENITVGIDSSPWLNYNRQKTDIRVALPLLEPAQRILAMYDCYNTHKRNSRLFPITKNQVVNRYLKQITIEAGVEKVVTFHMARHTV